MMATLPSRSRPTKSGSAPMPTQTASAVRPSVSIVSAIGKAVVRLMVAPPLLV